jgi:hypothetical protein
MIFLLGIFGFEAQSLKFEESFPPQTLNFKPYFVPHAGHRWCGRFFSPHFLQVPAGITDKASCALRCFVRDLLVLLFGTAIL